MIKTLMIQKGSVTHDLRIGALGCDPETLTGMIRGGLVNARKRRGRWYIPAAEVDRLKR